MSTENGWRQTAGSSGAGYQIWLWLEEELRASANTYRWRVTVDVDATGARYEKIGRHETCARLFDHLRSALYHSQVLDHEALLGYFPPSDAELHADNPLFGRF